MQHTPDPTAHQIIQAMPSRFNPEAATGVDAVIQFLLLGEGGGSYHAVIKDGTCRLSDGDHPDPTLTLKMSAQTYIDMALGRTTGQAAFFTQKLRYDGPLNLVIRLHRFFTT